jgi:mannose-1-phosphate guanylyltransferase/mannose-6-phosphate isomerase
MRLYPVIMCGGGGTRLWPASTDARPKPFMPVVGDRSPFQDTALRVAALGDVAQLVVVANHRHADLVEEQLAAVGLAAALLLEPQPRDSGPAIAVAAAWIAERDLDGVAVVVASDHHLPDGAAFRDAVRVASAVAARDQRLVTFGVTPRLPSTAYGYINPGASGGEVFDVAAFVEKPDAELAALYVKAGYLWNSGNFVATARVLLAAFDRHVADMGPAVAAALDGARRIGGRVNLGPAFAQAPRISFDHAVMEKTDRASVLPVGFDWSDLGAWSDIRSVTPLAADGNALTGPALVIDSRSCLIRSDGPLVAAIGVEDLAIVAENGAVLVCHMARDQSVKEVVARAKALARAGTPNAPTDAERAAAAERALAGIDLWLRATALPLWWSLGADHGGGGFHERLGDDGRPTTPARRLRVQARQAYVYARAGRLAWPGPWRAAVAHALEAMEDRYRRPDGLYRRLCDADGTPLDDTAVLYDNAFVLLALAEAARTAADPGPLIERADGLRAALAAFRWDGPGFRETVGAPFQANCHMHLFESCLAWLRVEGAGAAPWRRLAQEIADLAVRRFIDHDAGRLHEVFDEQWRRQGAAEGGCVEPGHQFEWAWLLDRWARLGGDIDPSLVGRLYDAGRAGVDPVRGVAVDRLAPDLSVQDATARLWPQTERLRAARMMWRATQDLAYADDVAAAAGAVRAYLETPLPGLWRDLQRENGRFVEEPAPATSLYHLIGLLQPPAD